jgi:hypothetical protein
VAPIPFNIAGYRFERGLQTLRESFEAAMRGVLQARQAIEAELTEYRQSLENGAKWIGERDDDGYRLWDRETLLEMDLEESAEAVDELRKAFVLAAYHFWERTIRSYCETDKNTHDVLVETATQSGIAVRQDLQRVQHLANVLKHNNRRWGERLIESWPEVLPAGLQPTGRIDWYMCVSLTDGHVGDVFEVILNSGPRSKLNGKEPWLSGARSSQS